MFLEMFTQYNILGILALLFIIALMSGFIYMTANVIDQHMVKAGTPNKFGRWRCTLKKKDGFGENIVVTRMGYIHTILESGTVLSYKEIK